MCVFLHTTTFLRFILHVYIFLLLFFSTAIFFTSSILCVGLGWIFFVVVAVAFQRNRFNGYPFLSWCLHNSWPGTNSIQLFGANFKMPFKMCQINADRSSWTGYEHNHLDQLNSIFKHLYTFSTRSKLQFGYFELNQCKKKIIK